MASIVPVLILTAAAEAFALTLLIPEHLPPHPFVWTLIRTSALNVGLYTLWTVFIYPFFVSPLRHLPQPKGSIPLVGHGYAMFRKPPAKDFLKWVTDIPNDGLIYFRGFLYQDRLLLTNPQTLAEVLVQKSYDFEKPTKLRNFLRRILGDGLIIVEGDEHKFQRKHIMPVFGFRHIKELYPMMWKKAVALTQGVAEEVAEGRDGTKDTVVEVNHWANKVTMDIIGVAGLGRDFGALRNSDDELIQNYEEILEPTLEKVLYFASQIVGPPAIIDRLPLRINKRMKATTGALNRICNELVRDKRKAMEKGGDEHLDILSVLIKSNNFSDQQLVDQLLTFLAAGHETTSSAFTWTTYLLATHPDIQTRLREEIRSAVSSGFSPEFDLAGILEGLPLLNAVCNETLRLYPTVPITIRDSIRPTTIGGQFIPKDTQILISPWAVNRSPHLWGDNASEFVPDRWIDAKTGKPNNNGGTSSNYSLLTFLHGPRSCIGERFAKAELRCLVASFVGAFEMEVAFPEEEVVPAGVITTKPRDGMKLRLRPVGTW
ncbi:putative P450 monooxygenase [Trichodelitschia bisporula]|uniref:Putative P450 monooxygenase n=1 Tax=Trichodelitschia bisporula TaxID=703511 RepID=A0A6G1I4F9_9PEZI|nr:putative P450 monooxygenase [Trichodelitschia bisporula]